jgi:hypothetical protein
MPIRRLLLITASLALFFVLGGTALAAKQYLLKRPSHEHCKSHYIKKTETVKKHEPEVYSKRDGCKLRKTFPTQAAARSGSGGESSGQSWASRVLIRADSAGLSRMSDRALRLHRSHILL